MEDIHILEIVAKIGALVGTKDTQGEAEQGPEMDSVPGVIVNITQVMDLRMAVMTWGNTVIRLSVEDLVNLQLTIQATLFRKTGLEESTTTAATEVVGLVGIHLDVVFFTNNFFYNKAKIVGNRVTKGFAYQLTWILNGEGNLAFLVPVGTWVQLAFTYPLCVVLDDRLDFKVRSKTEFLQSGPDCEELVSSFRVEPDIALKILHGLLLNLRDMLPGIVIA